MCTSLLHYSIPCVQLLSNRKMSAAGLLVCSFVPILSIFVLNINGQGNPNPGTVGIHRRFEYKNSFKPPYLAQKDGTVPFWEYGGSKYTSNQKLNILTIQTRQSVFCLIY